MIRRLKALGFLLALLWQVVIAPASFALTGFEVISGDVSLQQSGDVFNITSNSTQAIVQWQSFNVNAGQTVNFLLPTTTSSILNRVLGGGASNIFGNINSNGTVLLSNTAGINIGATANINTGGFIASTLNLSNANYLNDNWVFTRPDGVSSAGIINEGNITTATGGFVVLAGGSVMNTGNIFAPEGTVHLAVGDEIRVALGDNTVVDVTVNQALMEKVNTYQSAISNLGAIDARHIILQADLLESFYAETINNTGILRATTASNLGKSIRVYAFSDDQQALIKNGGVIDVSGTELAFDGGTLELVGDKILQEGQALADAYDGGTGGSVLISSTEQTTLAHGSLTSASGGTGTGDAGEIIIWSDKTTVFENGATIDVNGGDISGDGGFVEVSGYETVYFQGQAYGGSVDGQAGSILIDPLNIVIDNVGVDVVTGGDAGGTPDEAFAEDAGLTMTFDPQAGGSFNGFGDIHLQATNDITVNSAFDTSLATGNPSASLTLEANNNITINAPLTTNNGNITLLADADNSGAGYFLSTSAISSNGGDLTIQGRNNVSSASALRATNLDSGGGNITLTGHHTGAYVGSIENTSGIVLLGGYVVDSGGGNIMMTGSSSEQVGIGVRSAQVLSGGGTITMNGTGGSVAGGGFQRGIDIGSSAAALVDSGGGDISLTGSGADGGITHIEQARIRTQGGNFTANSSDSILLSSDLKTAGGDIIANANGSSLFIDYNTGSSLSRADIGTGGGNITINSDTVTMTGIGNPGPTVDLGNTGTMTFYPTTATNDIGLGGGAGALNLTASELDLIQNGTLALGDSSHTGDISLGTVDLSGQNLSLSLHTQGNVVDANGAANNITVSNGYGITINAGGNVGSIADPIELNTPLLNLYPSTLIPVFDGVASQINYLGAENSGDFDLGYYEGLLNSGLNPNGELRGYAILNSELLSFYNSSESQGTTDFLIKPYVTPGLKPSSPIFLTSITSNRRPNPPLPLNNLVNQPTAPVNQDGIRKAKRLIKKNGKLQLSSGI